MLSPSTRATWNPNRPFEAYNAPVTVRDPGPDGVANTADDGGTFTAYGLSAAALALPVAERTPDQHRILFQAGLGANDQEFRRLNERYLDLQGNKNGHYDVGDFRAFLRARDIAFDARNITSIFASFCAKQRPAS